MTRTTPALAGRPATAPAALADHAEAAGLRVLAAAAWPESAADRVPPPLPGFVHSTFSPLLAETATRCLTRRPPSAPSAPSARVAAGSGQHVSSATGGPSGAAAAADPAPGAVAGRGDARSEQPAAMGGPEPYPVPGAGPTTACRTAVVVVSALGDVAGAVAVAEAVDGGRRPGPLAFFQAVPNAVAGLVAARWGLRGPVVCVADGRAGAEVAALLIEDGDADEALVVLVDQAPGEGDRDRDRAEAVLLVGGDRS
jgi:hypothetical protein